MKDLFRDILEIDDIQGVIFLSFKGKIIFREFISQIYENVPELNWLSFIHTLDGVREAELIFEHNRFYIRRAESGYIFVIMGDFAIAEMVRLNCDILLPALEQIQKKPKGIGRFFKLT